MTFSRHITRGITKDTTFNIASEATLVFDEFTEPADTLLASHVIQPSSPTAGMSWTKDAGVGGTLEATVNAAADKLKVTTTGNGYAAWYFDAGEENRTVSTKIRAHTNGANSFLGIVTRLIAATSGTYIVIAGQKIQMWDYAVPAVKAEVALTLDPTLQDVTLVVEDDGVHLTAYILEEPSSIVSTDPLGPTPPAPAYTPPNPTSTLYGIYLEGTTTTLASATMDDYKVFF